VPSLTPVGPAASPANFERATGGIYLRDPDGNKMRPICCASHTPRCYGASSISFLTPTNGLRNTAPIRCPQANLSPAFPAAVARRIRPRARPHQPGGEPCGHRRRRDRATDRGSFCLKDRPPPQHRRLTSNNRSPYRQANTAGQCEKRTRSQPRLHVLGRRSLCLPADAALYSDQRGLGAGPIWQLLPKLDHAC